MSGHTPGPWMAWDNGNALGVGKDHGDEADILVAVSQSSRSRQEDMANMSLIAVAPNLLEAAVLAMRWWDLNQFTTTGEMGEYNLFDDEPEFVTCARSAIALSKGESQ